MTEKNYFPQPPKGVSRFLYRFPILMYQAGFGFLLGKRFLLLEHQGRKSGHPRKAVLEVIRFDPIENVYFVVSAFGDRADWYKNVSKNPEVRIQIGWTWMPARAHALELARTEEEILDYAKRNPRTFRILVEKLLEYEIGETEEELVEIAPRFIVVSIALEAGT